MKPKAINILGLDPGFGRTGYAVLRGSSDQPRLVDYGCLVTPPRQALPARLEYLRQAVKKLLSRWEPRLVAVEKVFFAANTKTALQVGEARGVLLVTVSEFGLPIVQYTPPQVKLAVTGDGRADKKQIQKMLRLLFKLPRPIKSDDAADAVAIAWCALAHLKLQSHT